MKRIVINVQTYGDFDIPGTDVIMMAPEGFVLGAAAKLARTFADMNSKTNDTSAVIKELKAHGFTVCKAVDLTIGGDL